MKINKLIRELTALAVEPINADKTVDVIKIGDGDAEISRLGVAMFATPKVIADAAKAGVNFLIVHEPLFYTHRDTEMPYAQCFEKKKLLLDAGLTVFRFHDYAHAMLPDLIYEGEIAFSGLCGSFERGGFSGVNRFILDKEMTTLELAKALEEAFGIKHLRIAGDRENTVKTVSCCFGAPGHIIEEIDECDTVLVGETSEWAICEYVRDGAEMGKKKSMIVMGHVNSEKFGMQLLAEKIRSAHPELSVEYFDCGEVYSYT